MSSWPCVRFGRLFLSVAFCTMLAACDDSALQTGRSQASEGPSSQGTSAPADIDLAQYGLTFRETFGDFDVSAWGPKSKWIAHTPWKGDFGDAEFSDPTPGFPFETASGMLRIEARKGADGRWRSGLIASRDHDGEGGPGFAQQFGYFEIDARLPQGTGVWPAFWLVGISPRPRAEIDVFEFHGNEPGSYHANVHVWTDGNRTFGDTKIVELPDGTATERFNRYGVRIDQAWMTFFLNRREVWKTPTRPEFRQPMYMIANLALDAGAPVDKLTSPTFMYVRSIAAYQKL